MVDFSVQICQVNFITCLYKFLEMPNQYILEIQLPLTVCLRHNHHTMLFLSKHCNLFEYFDIRVPFRIWILRSHKEKVRCLFISACVPLLSYREHILFLYHKKLCRKTSAVGMFCVEQLFNTFYMQV